MNNNGYRRNLKRLFASVMALLTMTFAVLPYASPVYADSASVEQQCPEEVHSDCSHSDALGHFYSTGNTYVTEEWLMFEDHPYCVEGIFYNSDAKPDDIYNGRSKVICAVDTCDNFRTDFFKNGFSEGWYYLAEDGLYPCTDEAESYSDDDIIEFGWYPQSKVDETEEAALITALNELAGDTSGWTSYGYYSANGRMTPSDFMRYTDVMYDGSKYRGVYFTSYRPYYTGAKNTDLTYQGKNGYNTETVYWFMYEPIKWRILDPATGMIMCDTIIDSQAYNNYYLSAGGEYWGNSSKTYYSDNYAESSIRQWLNYDFYNNAFSLAQQDIISYTELENKAYSSMYPAYDSETTSDKIYLLSYEDALTEKYGFSASAEAYDSARQINGSDYAKSQGLYVYNSYGGYYDGCSNWRLRSAGNNSDVTCYACYNGKLSNNCISNYTSYGIRPVLNLSPESEILQTDVSETGTCHGSGARNIFTVSFDAKGHGTAAEAQKVAAGEHASRPADLTADGWIFGGWFRDDNCENAWDFDTDTVTENITLHAKWTELYTVSFDANGHGSAAEAQKVIKGNKVQKPADLTEDGYVFGGWFRDDACENAWDFDTDTVTENITLRAKWTEDIPDEPDTPAAPSRLKIKGYKTTMDNVEYKSKLEFNVEGEVPQGYTVKWSTGDEGNSLTIKRATEKQYTVFCILVKDGQEVEGTRSETVNVNVNTCLIARIFAILRTIFCNLPTYTDCEKQ